MQKISICLLVMFAFLTIFLTGCGHDHDESDSIAPIHLEMDTENLQERVGLSGYIFGTFLLLNAYIIIILSCVALIVKEQTFQKVSDTLRLGLQMLNPSQELSGTLFKVLALLSDGETRFRIGTIGLVAGLVMAYFGAWVAT